MTLSSGVISRGIILTHRPYIIAEIGSNCFKYDNLKDNLKCALEQIDGAKWAGADAVKFQYFTASELWGPGYDNETFAILQNKYAMPKAWLPVLSQFAEKKGLEFLCSAFSVKGFEDVEPWVAAHKVASPELCAPGIHMAMESKRKPVIYSLGCTYVEKFSIMVNKKDTVLECISDYPADPTHYDLIATKDFAHYHNCKWGISDHTKFTWLCVYARSLGASVFEKHVNFVPNMTMTPDSGVSPTGAKFKEWALAIRDQPIVNRHKIKDGPIKLYSRRRRNGGWHRPLPEDGP